MEKGHYGKYTGNARCCMDHADTKVTASNYKATERDDAAHIDYLKQDIKYDAKHSHSDADMTADEKHISKLAGDMKYDKEHHGSPMRIGKPVSKMDDHEREIEAKYEERARYLNKKYENSPKNFDIPKRKPKRKK